MQWNGGTSRRYITIDNVAAGDKVTVYGGLSAGSTEQIHLVYEGPDGGTQDDQLDFATTPARYDFIAKYTGKYQIYVSASASGKPYFHRVVRTPGVHLSGIVNVNNHSLPTGYSLNFTNQSTNDTTNVSVNGDNSFDAVLAPGYTYVATLKDMTEYAISDSTKVIQVSASDITAGIQDIGFDVVTNSLATISGHIVGVDNGYDVSGLQIQLNPPTGSLAASVTAVVDTAAMTFTAGVQQGVSYTAELLGANDYEISSGGSVYIIHDTNQDMNVVKKMMYPATGAFQGLSPTAQIQSITFTNEDDGYTYTGTVANGGYSVSLRDGAYRISAVCTEDYSTIGHVVVSGQAVSKDILFEPVNPTVEPLAWVPDLYVGDSSHSGSFDTVKDALDAAARMNPTDEAHRITIHIAPGVYRAQLKIATPYITLASLDPTQEVKITWYYGIGYKYYSLGTDGWYNSALAFDQYDKHTADKWGATVYLTSAATAFRAEHIVFENSFSKYVTQEELDDGVQLGNVAGSTIAVERTASLDVTSRAAQERAAAMAIDADNVEFNDCSFIGGQDTLYTGGDGTHSMYVKDSYIEGNTDFIYGDGNVVFDHARLNFSGYSDSTQAGYLTAAKDSAAYGYVFVNSTITATHSDQSSFFGRPWGAGARVTFMNTQLQSSTVIDPAGWTSMSGAQPQNAHFAEYNTTYNGAPVDTSGRVVPALLDPTSVPSITTYFGPDWTPHYYTPAITAVLSATAGDREANLYWNTVTGATYYDVKRGTTSGVYDTVLSHLTGTSYKDTGLTNGTAYYYVVTAANDSGVLSTSNEVSVVPEVARPAAPTGVSVIAGDSKAQLSWNTVTGATYYNVKRGTTSGTYITVASHLTDTAYTDFGLTNGITYYYVVTASNSGSESVESDEVHVTPAVPPANDDNTAFTSQDIGPVGAQGGASYDRSANEFTVTGAGAIASGYTAADLDGLQFVGLSSKLSGDGTIIAKVKSFDIGGASAPFIGLQARTSLDANSNNASVIIKPTASSNGRSASYIPYYEYRDVTQGKNTTSTTASAVSSAADGSFYLKLAYQGSKLADGDTTTSTYYRSYIGQVDSSGTIQWTPAKSTSTKSAVSNSYYIGMYVVSNDPTNAVTVNFENVTIENSYDTAESTPLTDLDGLAAPTWAGTGSVTPAVAANGDLTLTWNPAYDNAGVAKYNIYEGSNLVGSTADGKATSFTVTKAMMTSFDAAFDPTTKAYRFTVQAVDTAGKESTDGPSTSSDIVPPAWTSGNLHATSVTQNKVNLTWTGASDSTGVTGYKVYDITDSANPVMIAAVDGHTTSYSVTRLNSSTNYVFKIEAGDSSENWSSDGPSLPVSTTAPIDDHEVPTWPSGQVTSSNETQTGLTLTWTHADDNVGVEKYKIYQGDSAVPVATVDGAVTTSDLTSLTPSTSYTFTVEAVDEAGNSSTDGPSVQVVTPAAPSWQAASLTASNTISAQPNQAGPVYTATLHDSVTLTWSGATDPIGVTGYAIFQQGVSAPIATVDASSDMYTVVGLTAGASYAFKVEALDDAGCMSTDGPSVEVTLPSTDAALLPPQHVSVPTLAYDDTSITLVWTKPDNYAEADIADYNVYMDGVKIGSANQNTASPAKSFIDSFYADSSNSEAVRISNHTYTVTGLTPNTTHTFVVRSVDSSGNESADSNSVTQATAATPQVFDVTDYGAVGDGATVDTAAIQAAIDATPEGGKVVIPAGQTFVSGSLWINKSNITFEVNGTLKASENAADFPYPDPTHQSAVKTYSLINAISTDTVLENIRFTGTGTIDGNGWKQDTPDADGFPVSLKKQLRHRCDQRYSCSGAV
ncbi:pectinesterase family protein [Paenibacillus hexagrammi]|uniref:Pectinesterase family protein n=1 Tax=Paenibacillus hexagrammi TaxID=2908839 RepID=A0ABY3SF70_9BACL|nr:pectinesterase family protein [Paenibacillus sp. YPD9-1]UJF32648.1 pectinesterase family protein [Paenibacillus sp. YPD9-1]